MSDPSNTDTPSAEQVHEQVRTAYTRAVSEQGGGCCGTGSAPATASEPEEASGCCGSSAAAPKGTVAKIAGYDPNELATLPADAVTNSFGCGDPVALAAIEPGATVLDLGSGAGIDVLLAAARVGPTGTVIGVDMTPAMIERARANAADAGLANVEIREGVIEALPVDDHSVDLVISNCVVNLSPNKPAVFGEIARVLKPAGRMSISDIVVEWLPDWMREAAALHNACIAGAIPEGEYVRGLEAAGLTEVEVTQRIVYSKQQLKEMLASEDLQPVLDAMPRERLEAALDEVEGKVWSAKFVGRKPA